MAIEGAEEEKISRRDLLSQQLDAEVEVVERAPAPKIETAPTTTAPTASQERVRGADGKFVSRETSPKQEKVAAPETPAPVVAPVEPPVWERAPRSWKKEFHEPWGKIDPKAREYIVQRENEMLARYSELGPKAKLADAINIVAEPYMNTVRGLGIDLPKAVQGLMAADNALRTLPADQKRAYFLQLGQSYGINLGEAPQAQPGQAAPPANDHALLNQVNSLRGELVSFKQQQEAAQQAEALALVNDFASKHEYFEDLRPTITKLIETGLETTLEGAYKHALKMNDELSEQIATAQQVKAQAAQKETANRAAKAAKAAAVSVRGSSPGARPASKAQSRREMLAEQLDSIDSRL